MSIKAEHVRALLVASVRPYTEEAKRSAVAYAEGQRRKGAGMKSIARELGISPTTLVSWLSVGPLVPVEIVATTESELEPESAIVLIDVRRGLRVEGLTVPSLVTLLERLP